MTWRDQLRIASFRGAAFHVRDLGGKGGRRGPLHEFPQRDDPWFEDLGRSARAWPVEGYVIGPGYIAARDRLLAALEAEGPGTLVLPWHAPRQAVCREFEYSESQREGGWCTFRIGFAEPGERPKPVEKTDTRAEVAAKADAARAELEAAFAAAWTVAGLPGFVAAEAAGWLRTLAALASRPLAGGGGAGAARAALAEAATALASGAEGLATAAELPAKVTGLAGTVRRAAVPAESPDATDTIAALARPKAARTPALDALDALTGGFAPAAAPSPVLTTARRAALANAAALERLVAGSAALERARAALAVPLDSYQAASALRSRVVAALDAEIARAGDEARDGAYLAMTSLRGAVIADLTARGAGLAPIVPYALGAPLPALALAHRLYQDADRAEDLAARNPCWHPAFLPASGEALSA